MTTPTDTVDDFDVDTQPAARESTVQTNERTLAILEIVAERGGASAREVSDALGYPIPTVYRLLQTLVKNDYLVHLRTEHRFELGFKLDRLGVSLHRQVGVPRPVRAEIAGLHDRAEAAAYFAVYRGVDVVVAYVVDSPAHPRLTPLSFGFHEAAHATAFGKVMLAGMRSEHVTQYMDVHGMPRLTPETMVSRAELEQHLEVVAQRGVAWEREEFVPGYDLRRDRDPQRRRDDRRLRRDQRPVHRDNPGTEDRTRASPARHREPGQPVLPLRTHPPREIGLVG